MVSLCRKLLKLNGQVHMASAHCGAPIKATLCRAVAGRATHATRGVRRVGGAVPPTGFGPPTATSCAAMTSLWAKLRAPYRNRTIARATEGCAKAHTPLHPFAPRRSGYLPRFQGVYVAPTPLVEGP